MRHSSRLAKLERAQRDTPATEPRDHSLTPEQAVEVVEILEQAGALAAVAEAGEWANMMHG